MKKVLFMPTPFPLLKGVFSGTEGEGVLFLVLIPPCVGHGRNWPRVVKRG